MAASRDSRGAVHRAGAGVARRGAGGGCGSSQGPAQPGQPGQGRGLPAGENRGVAPAAAWPHAWLRASRRTLRASCVAGARWRGWCVTVGSLLVAAGGGLVRPLRQRVRGLPGRAHGAPAAGAPAARLHTGQLCSREIPGRDCSAPASARLHDLLDRHNAAFACRALPPRRPQLVALCARFLPTYHRSNLEALTACLQSEGWQVRAAPNRPSGLRRPSHPRHVARVSARC